MRDRHGRPLGAAQDLNPGIELLGKRLDDALARNSRIEEDLVDQLFNSSEKRLARLLLLLANFGKEGRPELLNVVLYDRPERALSDVPGRRGGGARPAASERPGK
jgi:hypothetical protein